MRQNEAVKAQHLQLCGDGEGTKKDPTVLHEVKGTHRHSERELQDRPGGWEEAMHRCSVNVVVGINMHLRSAWPGTLPV